ncbi:hypothetical protein THAOC_34362 [Thalassiosira oceanica]|uniref:DUF6820 domain-containing protein n=1 Tax=Thalassiosira oceanica TaxID=159749 RepID=K0R2M8_THAOC|nr:hypothetical protein THAOC_34362 [Thalassiosira oceanica]|eukprot:EJK46948.1 hypothetical protein THAOC_34362 [Thalassiosira oceanica]
MNEFKVELRLYACMEQLERAATRRPDREVASRHVYPGSGVVATLICKSELAREANRQRQKWSPKCRPSMSPTQILGQKPEGGVDGPPDGQTALQGLSSIPHLTSVAAVSSSRSSSRQFFYNKCRYQRLRDLGRQAGLRARLMMNEFAFAPACLIDNVGRRVIGIALRPQHFIDDVLGMNRWHACMGAAIGPPGEAMEELDSPYHCCVGHRADRDRRGLGPSDTSPSDAGPDGAVGFSLGPWAIRHSEIAARLQPILALSSLYLALSLTIILGFVMAWMRSAPMYGTTCVTRYAIYDNTPRQPVSQQHPPPKATHQSISINLTN